MESVVDLKDGVLKGSEKVEEEVGSAVKFTEVWGVRGWGGVCACCFVSGMLVCCSL